MKEHVEQCYHQNCEHADEIIILYNLFKNTKKQDPINFIVRRNVQDLSKIETDCYKGAKINT
jgi:hypothetical protein